MEEEIPNISVAFLGDEKIGNHIANYFKTGNKKCSSNAFSKNVHFITMKIKDYNYVNFQIIVTKSLNENKNYHKKNFYHVPAVVFIWDKTSKESFNELKENLKEVNQLTKNAFKAIVSTHEGSQTDITETKELDRIAEDLNCKTILSIMMVFQF